MTTTPQEIFLIRLRRRRQHARIPIEEIAGNLRIRPELIEAFERNDLSAWPSGVQARAWVRGYAATVELDVEDTVEEFCRLFLEGDRRAAHTMRVMAIIADTVSHYQDDHTGQGRRLSDPEPEEAWPESVERLGRSVLDRVSGSLKPRRRPRTAP